MTSGIPTTKTPRSISSLSSIRSLESLVWVASAARPPAGVRERRASVSAKDMKSFRLHDAEDHISANAGGKLVPSGTVLMLVRGMTLHDDVPICMTMREMAFNQDIKAIRAKPNLNNQFLACWLLAHGGTYGHALYLVLPEALFLSVAKTRNSIQKQIAEDLNNVHNVQNEFIQEVFLEMEAAENTDWRKDSGLLLASKRVVAPRRSCFAPNRLDEQNVHAEASMCESSKTPARLIGPLDWNFDAVPDTELMACCYWEYARESAVEVPG